MNLPLLTGRLWVTEEQVAFSFGPGSAAQGIAMSIHTSDGRLIYRRKENQADWISIPAENLHEGAYFARIEVDHVVTFYRLNESPAEPAVISSAA